MLRANLETSCLNAQVATCDMPISGYDKLSHTSCRVLVVDMTYVLTTTVFDYDRVAFFVTRVFFDSLKRHDADVGGKYPVRRRTFHDLGHVEDQRFSRAVLVHSRSPPSHSAQRGGMMFCSTMIE